MTSPTTPRDAIELSERLRKQAAYDDAYGIMSDRSAMRQAAAQLDEFRREINDWANEVARYKSYAEKFDEENAALSARVKELEGQVYVPGSWHCPKCKFTLLQSNLNAQDGTVTARDTPGDKCPNCNGPLWRCTWKHDAFEMQERAAEQMERAKAAESRATRAEQERDEAYERLKPFAFYFDLNDCDDRADDDAMEIPIRDLRAARDIIRSLASGPDKEKIE